MSSKQILKQEELTKLSSRVSRLIKTKYGKGPETCHATISEEFVIISFRKFMTKIEEELQNKGEAGISETIRRKMMDDLLEPIREAIEELSKKPVLQIYQDWNFLNNTGIVVGVLEQKMPAPDDNAGVYDQIKDEILKQNGLSVIVTTNYSFHRVGLDIYVCKLTDLLQPLEKTMYRKGYYELLRDRENEIRSNYANNITRFENVLKKKLEDVFLIRDYQQDVNYTIFHC